MTNITINGLDLDELVELDLVDEDYDQLNSINSESNDLSSGLSFDSLDHEEKKQVRKELRKFRRT